MIPDKKEWPKSGGIRYLCLTRQKDGNKEYGFLYGDSWEVNIGYIFDGGTGQYISYSSKEEIERDGWKVD